MIANVKTNSHRMSLRESDARQALNPFWEEMKRISLLGGRGKSPRTTPSHINRIENTYEQVASKRRKSPQSPKARTNRIFA